MKIENKDKLASMIGFAKKSGNIVSGVDSIIEAIRKNKVISVLLSRDCSDRTKKQLSDKCLSYNVKLVLLPFDGQELSGIVGHSSVLSAVAIKDANFASSIDKLLEE